MDFTQRVFIGDREPSSHQLSNSLQSGNEYSSEGMARTLWRRRLTLLGAVLVTSLFAAIYLFRAVPIYASNSRLFFEQTPTRLVNGSESLITESYLHAQCEILKSSPILADAVTTLAAEDKAKQPQPAPAKAEAHAAPAPPMTPAAAAAAEEQAAAVLQQEVATLQLGLDAIVGKDDDIITVTYESPDPTRSARVVNAVVKAYVNFEAQHRRTSAADTLRVLQREKDKVDGELSTLQSNLLAFKKSNDVLSLDSDRGNIITQRLSQMGSDLASAQVQTMDADAHYQAAAAVAANPTVDSVGRVDRAREQAKLDLIASRQTLDIAKRREASIKQAFDESQASAINLNMKMAEYARLQSDVLREEKMSETLDGQIKSINFSEDADPLAVRILEVARPEFHSVRPQRVRIAAMAVILGLLAGVGLALVQDVFDQRVRTAEDVRSGLGMAVLGVVPHLPRSASVAASGLAAHSDPMSDLAESCRSVRTAIYFISRSAPVKTLLVTSPNAGDGKTTFLSNLAIAMAQAGNRTLVLDANFRQPMLQTIYGNGKGTGLSEVLAGRTKLEDAITRTPVEGLEFLPCGPVPRNPSEMLNDVKFVELLKTLSASYQFILLDSPPLSSVTDARILGATADATLFVVRAGVTSRKSAGQGLDSLLSVGTRVLGAVVNDVPRRRSSKRVYPQYQYDDYAAASRGREVARPVPLLAGAGVGITDVESMD
jgi:succinoglycan biosynthesis transport protein ExoP